MSETKKAGGSRKERKDVLVKRFHSLLETYKNILIVGVDNVGSNQMQKTRIALRGKAEVLMGKNTIVRTQLRKLMGEGNKKVETFVTSLPWQCGSCFYQS